MCGAIWLEEKELFALEERSAGTCIIFTNRGSERGGESDISPAMVIFTASSGAAELDEVGGGRGQNESEDKFHHGDKLKQIEKCSVRLAPLASEMHFFKMFRIKDE